MRVTRKVFFSLPLPIQYNEHATTTAEEEEGILEENFPRQLPLSLIYLSIHFSSTAVAKKYLLPHTLCPAQKFRKPAVQFSPSLILPPHPSSFCDRRRRNFSRRKTLFFPSGAIMSSESQLGNNERTKQERQSSFGGSYLGMQEPPKHAASGGGSSISTLD